MYHGQSLASEPVDFRDLHNVYEWLRKKVPLTRTETDEHGIEYECETKIQFKAFKGIGEECKTIVRSSRGEERTLIDLAEKFIDLLARSTLGEDGTAEQYWNVDSRRHLVVGLGVQSVSRSTKYPRVRLGRRTTKVKIKYEGGQPLKRKEHYIVQLDLHRMACYLAHGPVPEGRALALHTCHRPSCLNPRHLYWGSASHNQLDAYLEERRDPSRAGDESLW